jgi:hypothetical protein
MKPTLPQKDAIQLCMEAVTAASDRNVTTKMRAMEAIGFPMFDLLWGGRAIIGYADDAVMIAIRGTSEIRDIVIDGAAIQVPHPGHPGMMVHAGFLYGATQMKKDLEVHLPWLQHKIVYCTGHSMGGAVAELVAASLADRGIEARVITFGAPKAGNHRWTKWFNRVIPYRIRVVVDKDGVPSIPFGFGYRQTKGLLQLTNAGNPMDPIRGTWNRVRNFFKFFRASFISREAMTDHVLFVYRHAVAMLCRDLKPFIRKDL